MKLFAHVVGVSIVMAIGSGAFAQSANLAEAAANATGDAMSEAPVATAVPGSSGEAVDRTSYGAGAVYRSAVPVMFRFGDGLFHPRTMVPSPLGSLQPNTFSQRRTSWRLGYYSDGVRGSYFR